MRGDELVNGGREGADAPMHAASQLLRGQFGEPALHEIELGRVGRDEVDVEPRPLGEPSPDKRRLVGRVVVHDDVHVEVGGHALVDAVEELAELDGRWRRCVSAMTVPVLTSSAANSDEVPCRR